jgi:hypothetical protein
LENNHLEGRELTEMITLREVGYEGLEEDGTG